MKILFLTIALSLFIILQAGPTLTSENVLKGTYYINTIVSSMEFLEKNDVTMSPLTFSQLKDGNMEVTLTTKLNGKCEDLKVKLERTEDPGKFSVDEGKRHVYLTKTSVSDHWIIICEGELHGEQIRVVKLVGPNTHANPLAMNEFMEFIKKEGLGDKRIISPRQEGGDIMFNFRIKDIQEIPAISSND
ncbi:late lactation protein B-like [Gracilinanus agilis]|uniref:late lactation protein B-like n=1 Tax=Gracilinanus agilis TaxID=191870 RepID=UPI001CFD1DE1|nr:late lactation protein B-like [Gracilinanus agilis]